MIAINRQIPQLVNNIKNPDSARKAISLLDRATTIDENCYLCYENKIMFYAQLKAWDHAIEAINQQIRLKPKAIELISKKGYLYLLKGDSISAFKYLSQSVQMSSNILDTMSYKNSQYTYMGLNQVCNLVLLGDTVKANIVLKTLYDHCPADTMMNSINFSYKEEILRIMNLDKKKYRALLLNATELEKQEESNSAAKPH